MTSDLNAICKKGADPHNRFITGGRRHTWLLQRDPTLFCDKSRWFCSLGAFRFSFATCIDRMSDYKPPDRSRSRASESTDFISLLWTACLIDSEIAILVVAFYRGWVQESVRRGPFLETTSTRVDELGVAPAMFLTTIFKARESDRDVQFVRLRSNKIVRGLCKTSA